MRRGRGRWSAAAWSVSDGVVPREPAGAAYVRGAPGPPSSCRSPPPRGIGKRLASPPPQEREDLMAIDTLIALVGVYDDVADAEADYELVKELHTEAGLIDAYDGGGGGGRGGGQAKNGQKD